MFNPKEYMDELVASGLTKEEACKETRKEIEKRKQMVSTQIKFANDDSSWFRNRCERFKR